MRRTTARMMTLGILNLLIAIAPFPFQTAEKGSYLCHSPISEAQKHAGTFETRQRRPRR